MMKSFKFIAGGIILSLPILAGCASGGDGDSGTSEQPSAQVSESAPPEIEIIEGQVPNVTDRSLYDAIVALRAAELRYEVTGDGFNKEDESQNTRAWNVTDQSPASGENAKAKDVVELTVERVD